MHKIKLKTKINVCKSLLLNLHKLNFIFGLVSQKDNLIKIIFYSQYQLERFLNITELENYKIKTFVEKFENHHKIVFSLFFNEKLVENINKKLINYLGEKENV